ncbi:TetR family transcriptional regulator [Mycetohabitans endofungorum]|uniref:TetR family transcriptional regulator n=2 Tax=Burkholderiaceae TaxID=119060 RepID=A0A2P5K865_9BURK|nr:TetR family transcriptional regulator [Mycetohabitans endofungorum]
MSTSRARHRTRLTREQSREQTRQRLMDAAQTLFVKKGFDASSVEDVAAAAGYTRGAFYSNFKDKAELLLALLKRDHGHIQQALQRIFDLQGSAQGIEAQILTYYSTLYRKNKCFLVWMQARLLATRDAKFRARLNALSQQTRADIAHFIEAFSARQGVRPIVPAAQLALGLMALCDGIQLFHESDPYVTNKITENVLAAFFGAAAFNRRAAGPR